MPEASKRVEIKIICKKEKMKEINATNISKSNQLIKGEQVMPKPKNQKSLRKMQKIKRIGDKIMGIATKNKFLTTLGLVGLTSIIYPEIASADLGKITGLSEVSKTVVAEVQGDGLKITLNVVGIGCIIYSLFNGFNKAVLVLGGLILVYANIYFKYVNGLFG